MDIRINYCDNDKIKDMIGYYNLKRKADSLSYSGEIFIYSGLPAYQQRAILAHEYGHALCDKQECCCILSENWMLAEYHAQTYSLRRLLKQQDKEALRFTIESYRKHCDNEVYGYSHSTAAKKTVSTTIWKMCEKYLAEEQ